MLFSTPSFLIERCSKIYFRSLFCEVYFCALPLSKPCLSFRSIFTMICISHPYPSPPLFLFLSGKWEISPTHSYWNYCSLTKNFDQHFKSLVSIIKKQQYKPCYILQRNREDGWWCLLVPFFLSPAATHICWLQQSSPRTLAESGTNSRNIFTQ